jgi:hypothetical protein
MSTYFARPKSPLLTIFFTSLVDIIKCYHLTLQCLTFDDNSSKLHYGLLQLLLHLVITCCNFFNSRPLLILGQGLWIWNLIICLGVRLFKIMLVIPFEVVMGWGWFCGKSRPHNLRRASTTMLSHGFLRVCSNCQSSCLKHIITDIEIHCKLWIPHLFPWSLESGGKWTLQFSTIVGCKLEQIIWNVISAGCKLWTTEAVFF